mmetsp:Transcript_26375/g.57543  ORF Transcript_26375/g.57543 Transcript_26375/m.57543 type:complete len:215 (-) Transcript_26375:746-1390(-)
MQHPPPSASTAPITGAAQAHAQRRLQQQRQQLMAITRTLLQCFSPRCRAATLPLAAPSLRRASSALWAPRMSRCGAAASPPPPSTRTGRRTPPATPSACWRWPPPRMRHTTPRTQTPPHMGGAHGSAAHSSQSQRTGQNSSSRRPWWPQPMAGGHTAVAHRLPVTRLHTCRLGQDWHLRHACQIAQQQHLLFRPYPMAQPCSPSCTWICCRTAA